MKRSATFSKLNDALDAMVEITRQSDPVPLVGVDRKTKDCCRFEEDKLTLADQFDVLICNLDVRFWLIDTNGEMVPGIAFDGL